MDKSIIRSRGERLIEAKALLEKTYKIQSFNESFKRLEIVGELTNFVKKLVAEEEIFLKEHDNCQMCYGIKGGEKGNENILHGVKMCDYCTAHFIQPFHGKGTSDPSYLFKLVERKGDPEWVNKLCKELLMSKMTHTFSFTRDEIIELLTLKQRD